MREGVLGQRFHISSVFLELQVGSMGQSAKCDDHFEALEQGQLSLQEGATFREFFSRRLVVRRSAVYGGCDEAVDQLKAVVDRIRGWLGCESCGMERTVEKLAGAVPCEHAPCAVCTVGAGRKADDEYLGIDCSEGWDRFTPVLPVLVRLALYCCNSCTVIPQPGALPARDDFSLKRVHLGLKVFGHEGNDQSTQGDAADQIVVRFRFHIRIGIVVRYKTEPP